MSAKKWVYVWVPRSEQYCPTSLVPSRSLSAHTTWREISWRHRMAYHENAFSRDLIRWRHDISLQVESSEREEKAWVLGYCST